MTIEPHSHIGIAVEDIEHFNTVEHGVPIEWLVDGIMCHTDNGLAQSQRLVEQVHQPPTLLERNGSIPPLFLNPRKIIILT
ncbi:hypothetical protein, partial [Rubritalea profundi]|uniref:hypothetical protein n=1 Tax=Rubritalea profundi TaxID=1658618 RepID=UPI00198122CF